MGRILCLDYGRRRTGVALSDETRTIAQSLTTITHPDEAALVAAVRKLATEHEVDLILLGLPLGRAGNPSARSQEVKRFGAKLAASTGLEVVYADERCSTLRAGELLAEAGIRPRRRAPARRRYTTRVDRLAATIILEDYLETLRSA
uniref:Putative pre-16S rRNA nuclease n=1 Tax=candidate division WOR-3 bacterium TaxID=2052148 RepID=A0A7C4GDD0_UNCW3